MTGLALTGGALPALHPGVGHRGCPDLTTTPAETRAENDRAGRAVGKTVGELPRGSDPTPGPISGVAPRGLQPQSRVEE